MDSTHVAIVTLQQQALEQGRTPTAIEISLEDEAKLVIEMPKIAPKIDSLILRDGIRKHLTTLHGLPIVWGQPATRIVCEGDSEAVLEGRTVSS